MLFDDQPAQVGGMKNARLLVGLARGPARGFEVINIIAVENARAIDGVADAGNLDVAFLVGDEDRAGGIAGGTGVEHAQWRRDRRVSHGVAIFFRRDLFSRKLRVGILGGVAILAKGDFFQQGLEVGQRDFVDARVFQRDQGNRRRHRQSAGAIDGIDHFADDAGTFLARDGAHFFAADGDDAFAASARDGVERAQQGGVAVGSGLDAFGFRAAQAEAVGDLGGDVAFAGEGGNVLDRDEDAFDTARVNLGKDLLRWFAERSTSERSVFL